MLCMSLPTYTGYASSILVTRSALTCDDAKSRKSNTHRVHTGAMVTAWRAVPAAVDTIRPGDWVALDPEYCMSHRDGMQDWTGEPWKVIEATLPLAEIAWAGDLDEWHDDSGEAREFLWMPSAESAVA